MLKVIFMLLLVPALLYAQMRLQQHTQAINQQYPLPFKVDSLLTWVEIFSNTNILVFKYELNLPKSTTLKSIVKINKF